MPPSKDPKKTVYGLVDPRDGALRYIGASKAPLRRYEQHLGRVGPPTRDMTEWLDELESEGLRPDLRLLTGPTTSWRKVELDLQRLHGSELLDTIGRRSLPDVKSRIGQNLTEARLLAGLSQEDAAAAIPASQATISRYESGDRTPSVRSLLALSQAYGVSVQHLLEGELDASQGATEDTRKARA